MPENEEKDDMSGFNRSSKLQDGDFYTTPEGYLVFTEQYLLRRGYCCQNGCRHCPYGFSKGSLPRKKGFNS